MDSHPDENSLLEFVEGKLAGPARARVAGHVESCADCRRVMGSDSSAQDPTPDRATPGAVETTEMTDPLIGQRVGAWQIGPRLGAGGMGIIYAATHFQTGQPAAFKLVRSHLAQEPALLKRFQREIELVAQLDHPNIVRVLDVGTFANKEPFCVLELLEGVPLSTFIKRQGRLPATEVIDLLVQLMDALEAAHGAHIVHRDLKPSNLFLRTVPEGTRLTVLDFGLAKNLSSTHETALSGQGLLGTPEYMAPEQIRGQTITPAVDLYAVGVLAWELLVGHRPISGNSPAAVIVRQLEEQPPNPSQFVSMPAALDGLIMSLLEKEPARRPTDAAAVKRQLLAMRPARRTPRSQEGVPSRTITAIEPGTELVPSVPEAANNVTSKHLEPVADELTAVKVIRRVVLVGAALSCVVVGLALVYSRTAPRNPYEPPVDEIPETTEPVGNMAPPRNADVLPRPSPIAASPPPVVTRPRPAAARPVPAKPRVASESAVRARLDKLRACVPRLPQQNRAMSSAMLDECDGLISAGTDASRTEALGLLEKTERQFFAGACP